MAKLMIPEGLDPAVDRIPFAPRPEDPDRAYRWHWVRMSTRCQVIQAPVLGPDEDWSGDMHYYEMDTAAWPTLCGLFGMDTAGRPLP